MSDRRWKISKCLKKSKESQSIWKNVGISTIIGDDWHLNYFSSTLCWLVLAIVANDWHLNYVSLIICSVHIVQSHMVHWLGKRCNLLWNSIETVLFNLFFGSILNYQEVKSKTRWHPLEFVHFRVRNAWIVIFRSQLSK